MGEQRKRRGMRARAVRVGEQRACGNERGTESGRESEEGGGFGSRETADSHGRRAVTLRVAQQGLFLSLPMVVAFG